MKVYVSRSKGGGRFVGTGWLWGVGDSWPDHFDMLMDYTEDLSSEFNRNGPEEKNDREGKEWKN